LIKKKIKKEKKQPQQKTPKLAVVPLVLSRKRRISLFVINEYCQQAVT